MTFSSPYENRTRDSSVKGMRLNPLTNGPFLFLGVQRYIDEHILPKLFYKYQNYNFLKCVRPNGCI